MARISTYAKDITINKDDKVIGSDTTGETRNYLLKDLLQFANDSGILNIGDLLTFKYGGSGTSANDGYIYLTSGTALFSGTTELTVSHNDLSNQNIKNLLDYLVGQNVIISQTDNKNIFGHFAFNSLTQVGGNSYSVMAIGHLESNGSFTENKYYTISLSPKGQSDKHHIFDNGGLNYNFSANTPVTVTHNLGKIPSVSIIKSNGDKIMGEIEHIDTTEFRVTFTSSFDGKIYSN